MEDAKNTELIFLYKLFCTKADSIAQHKYRCPVNENDNNKKETET